MIFIKNLTVFKLDVNHKCHWSKLPKLVSLMKKEFLGFKRGADLRGAYLTDADLRGADLTGADLTGADLRGADLTGAYLTDADLRGAYLTGAYLTDAYLTGADLTGADLTGAYLTDADLRGADLRGAYLTDADLRGAYLTDADLRGADLRGAYLTDAYLTGADLRGADLTGADLRGAYLTDADLRGADKDTPEKIKIEDFIAFDRFGSENRCTHFFKTDIGIVVRCGCFYGTEKAFKEAVKKTHGNGQHAKEYNAILKVVKIRFDRKEGK